MDLFQVKEQNKSLKKKKTNETNNLSCRVQSISNRTLKELGKKD